MLLTIQKNYSVPLELIKSIYFLICEKKFGCLERTNYKRRNLFKMTYSGNFL